MLTALTGQQPCRDLARVEGATPAAIGLQWLRLIECEQEREVAGNNVIECAQKLPQADVTTPEMAHSLGSFFTHLCKVEVSVDPYVHLSAQRVLPHELTSKLRTEVPTNDAHFLPVAWPGACPDLKCQGPTFQGKTSMGKGLVHMLRHDANVTNSPWLAKLRSVLHSTLFKHLLWERLRLEELHGYVTRQQTFVATSLFRDFAGYDINPHPDTGFKLASFFIPLPDDLTARMSGLGTLRCKLKADPPKPMLPGSAWQAWDNFDCTETGFSHGNLFAFRVTSDRLPAPNRSWHAIHVPPIPGGRPRVLFRGHVCNWFLQGKAAPGSAYAPLPWQRRAGRALQAKPRGGRG